MPFVDIVFLKHDSIINGIIYYERNKTGQRMQVRVIPPLAALIEKYRSSYPYVLPYITSFSDRTSYMQYRYALGNVNRLLKRLGRRLHLPLVLTTYVARHSWATIAKEEGFSIASISEGLGHTSEATTQIYLQSFNSEVIDKINEQVVASIGRHI
ncbi:phage integrase family protein [Bacteroides fragilis str. A7 (UDC12-2)]